VGLAISDPFVGRPGLERLELEIGLRHAVAAWMMGRQGLSTNFRALSDDILGGFSSEAASYMGPADCFKVQVGPVQKYAAVSLAMDIGISDQPLLAGLASFYFIALAA